MKEKVIVVEGRTCPQCESTLVIKNGPYGRFIGCSSYPMHDRLVGDFRE